MVTFILPRSQTLEIAECPKRLAVVHGEKEPLRISFRRTTSKSPERARPRTSLEERPSKAKPSNSNSWFKSITSSLINGGGNSPRAESSPTPPQFDAPTHVRRRTLSLVDSCKAFTSQAVAVDPRLPDHMRRKELQLRRIQGREVPSPKSHSNRSSPIEQAQKYSLWWSA